MNRVNTKTVFADWTYHQAQFHLHSEKALSGTYRMTMASQTRLANLLARWADRIVTANENPRGFGVYLIR